VRRTSACEALALAAEAEVARSRSRLFVSVGVFVQAKLPQKEGGAGAADARRPYAPPRSLPITEAPRRLSTTLARAALSERTPGLSLAASTARVDDVGLKVE